MDDLLLVRWRTATRQFHDLHEFQRVAVAGAVVILFHGYFWFADWAPSPLRPAYLLGAGIALFSLQRTLKNSLALAQRRLDDLRQALEIQEQKLRQEHETAYARWSSQRAGVQIEQLKKQTIKAQAS
ncbi:hypothetical protein [Anthocerotibacter panamensis]|uniref:hypothetical protein n=1 Tax=Anthocerotibacter panamensis TaxID=2857077 RepID=UPI001C405B34|nr:hypothetical protein [Anthocerotibacter panamensis]